MWAVAEAAMLRFLYENFYLSALTFAAASYAVTLVASRRRSNRSTTASVGRWPALTASLVAATLYMFLLVALNPLAYLLSPDSVFEILRLPWLFTAGIVALTVLVVFAIWPPPGERDRSAAAGRALAGALIAVISMASVDGMLGSAAATQAEADRVASEAAEQSDITTRSEALSIAVSVVDARLAESSQYGGRIVSHLSLEIEVRATRAIELVGPDGGISNWMNLSADSVSSGGVQPQEPLDLPTLLPAGFETTYRLEVPIDELTSGDVPVPGFEPADQFVTGPWTARLSLYGAHPPGTPQVIYTSTTSFEVPMRP
jgi:hypothetical protein